MSVQSPPTFQKLARQTLLRNEAVIISFLEELPTVLFPALFKEAFEGRHSKLMKEQVTTWPFPCLPVGALMKTPNLETLHAVLEGVDMLLTRDIHHSKRKFQFLALRNVHHMFWHIWADEEDGSCSSESLDENPVVKEPDDTLGETLHQALPNFTERLGFLLLLSEPLSPKTSGDERCNLKFFGYYASEKSRGESGR
ncbi:PRAME family member 3-like isoform X3 [Rattus norvegicus]|uniref:PRAME family member 3-like isoform X3 n=1 Tax=Rattus norvegicus TaxID=10116 RepID=UPI002FD7DB33